MTGLTGIGVLLVIRYPKFAKAAGLICVALSIPLTLFSWLQLQAFPEQPKHMLLSQAVAQIPSTNLWIILDDIKWDCNHIYYQDTGDTTFNTYIVFVDNKSNPVGLAVFNQKYSCDAIMKLEVSGTLGYLSRRQGEHILPKIGVDAGSATKFLEFCTYCGRNNSTMGVISGGLFLLAGLVLISDFKILRAIFQKRHPPINLSGKDRDPNSSWEP